MRDPEEFQGQRRTTTPLRPRQGEAAEATPSTFELERTMARLARDRAGDELAEPIRLLATIRGDRRPFTVAELNQAVAEVAAAEGLDAQAVRTMLDRALLSEGSSLQAWEQQLRRPRPRLGAAPKVSREALA